MKKRSRSKSILTPAIIFLIFWLGAVVHSEILTFKHGHEFETAFYEAQLYNAIGHLGHLKILRYSDTTARVYFVSINRYGGISGSEIGDRLGGHVFVFSNDDGQWVVREQERLVWSRTGSARNGFVWPHIR